MTNIIVREIKKCFQDLNSNPECRSIVLSGNGKGFTSGLDLTELSAIMPADIEDVGRKAFFIRKMMEKWQQSMSASENVIKFNRSFLLFDLILIFF